MPDAEHPNNIKQKGKNDIGDESAPHVQQQNVLPRVFWSFYHFAIVITAIVIAWSAVKGIRQTEKTLDKTAEQIEIAKDAVTLTKESLLLTERSLKIAQQSAKDNLAETKATVEWAKRAAIMINRPVLGMIKPTLKSILQEDDMVLVWGQVTLHNTGNTSALNTKVKCSMHVSSVEKCTCEFSEIEGIESMVTVGKEAEYVIPSREILIPISRWNGIKAENQIITMRVQAIYTDAFSSDVWECNFLAFYRPPREDSSGNIGAKATWTVCPTGNSCN